MSPTTPELTRRAMRLSIWEGVVWALMVGLGETYFVADAVRLGATALELGLVVTLPLALAGIGPLVTLSLLRVRSRRALATLGASAQTLTLAVLATLEWTGILTPRSLIAVACIYAMAGQAAGTAWSSWYGDLVPAAERGRYFARRNRAIYVTTCLGLVLGGLLLQRLEPASAGAAVAAGGGLGFAVIFTIAVACRAASAILLARSPEPPFRGIADRHETRAFFTSRPGRRALSLLAVATTFHFAAYLSSPYFGPFMLETLRFTYVEYMIASVWVVVIKALSTLWWGRGVDRFGAGRMFRLALFLVGLVPVPWIVAHDLWIVLLGQGLSGLAWCGYELGFFTSMLESTTPATRPSVFAAQSLVVGWAQLAAGVIAAHLLGALDGGFRTLFAISAGLRLGIAALMPLWMRRDVVLVPVRTAALSFRSLGFRPSGGLSRRPVFDAPDEVEGDPIGALPETAAPEASSRD